MTPIPERAATLARAILSIADNCDEAGIAIAQSSNSGASVTALTLNAPTKTATAPTPAPSPNTAHGAIVTAGGRVA